jgi:hypothetical protein
VCVRACVRACVCDRRVVYSGSTRTRVSGEEIETRRTRERGIEKRLDSELKRHDLI